MTYYGFVLLFAGYQADEARTLRVYKAIVDGWVFFSFSSSHSILYSLAKRARGFRFRFKCI
jgi:hypothetical protein